MSYRTLLATASVTATLSLAATAVQADFVINDDLIVDGSACIGFDCVNGESFGFDTIRLKENNLRIKFDDTSTAASYPRNDWQLTANASANGGASKFSIDDITGGRTPFTVEANAPSNSLYVDDGGRIGNGTSTPSVEFHTIDGDTPTVRLQQDGSSGFAPQTWDVAGNETNFFVRDVTNGSTLPFRIRPGAPTSSIFIDVDGDVGIGTSSPSARMTVDTNVAEALTIQGDGTKHLDMISDNDGATQLRLVTASNTRNIVAQDTATGGADVRIAMQNSRILLTGPDAVADQWLLVEAAGITVQGDVVSGGSGTCAPPAAPCDGVFDPEVYTVPSIEEYAALMWDQGHLPLVGPTLPNQPINVTDKMTRMLNALEHAHIYIDQLNRHVTAQDKRIADLERKLVAQ